VIGGDREDAGAGDESGAGNSRGEIRIFATTTKPFSDNPYRLMGAFGIGSKAHILIYPPHNGVNGVICAIIVVNRV
jgi:hypothetical protein